MSSAEPATEPIKEPVKESSSEPVPTAEPVKTEEGEEKKEEEKKEEEKPMVTAGELFQFADGFDKFLMIFGGFCAFCNGAGMPAFSEVFGRLLNGLNDTNVEERVTEAAKIMIWVGLVVLALSAIQVSTWMVSSTRQMTRIRAAYFRALLRQDMAWHDEHKPGEVGARLSGDTRIIQQGINDKFANGLMNVGMMLFGFGFGFYRSWQLTLVMLGTMPLIAITGIVMATILTSMTKLSREGFAKAGEISTEVLENIRTVQIFGTEEKEITRFIGSLGPAKAAGKKRDFTTSLGVGASYGIIFASYSVAFWFASYLVEWGENNVGEITAVFFSVLMGSFAVGLIFPSISAFSEARAAAHEVFAVIRRVPEIDPDHRGETIENLEGRIEFKNVKFSYPTRKDQKLFTDLNVTVEAGTSAAFSGVSGCGKSSVIALLQRFYDPNEGQVLVDGKDLKTLDVSWWRDQIGIVSQEPNLFSGTIIENVRLGKPNATVEEVVEACKAANIHDLVLTLPDKYDTNVGAVGSQLSGGQKQRIAIARAIVKRPKILILDEATSALDRKSEAEVQAALDDIMKGHDGRSLTVVVVAHRLTTIRNCTRIHYITYDAMVGSTLEESGSFEELMEKKGHFAVMASKQSRSVDTTERQASSVKSTNAASTRNKEVAKEEGEEKVPIDKLAEEETKNAEATMSRIIKLNAGNGWAVFIGFIGSLISGGLYPAYAVVLAKMLEVLAIHANDPITLREKTPLWASLFIAIGFASFVGWSLQGFYGVAGEELTEKLRIMLFRNLLRQDMMFFDTPGREVGTLGANLSGDCEAVHQLWGPSIGYKLQMACNLTAGITIAFIYQWKIAFVTFATIPFMIVTGAVQQMLLVGFGNTEDGKMSDDAVAVEALSNIRTVAAFNAGPAQTARYTALVEEKEGPQKRNGAVAGVAFGISQFTFYGVFALSFWYGGTLIQDNPQEVSFADVMIASMALLMGAMGAGEAGGFAAKLQDAETASKRVFALIDRVPSIDPHHEGGISKFDDKVEVKFDNAVFRYPARPDAVVLNGLNTTFSPLQSVGLMGKTGCGKSTIIQLLARFYDPNAGEITVNGDSLKHVNLVAWRSQLSLVMQEPALFSGSVRDNIAYGVAGATDEEIKECARLAQIHDDIMRMPGDYDCDVGYRGKKLSGGQKQRVAIARALLRKPKILLLDEATSALDNATEAAVQRGIDEAMKRHPMMSVSIAHRLTTIRDADRILLMEEGDILESGTHDELMALDGEYKSRWELYQAASS